MHKLIKYPIWLARAVIWTVTLSVIILVFSLIYGTTQELSVLERDFDGSPPAAASELLPSAVSPRNAGFVKQTLPASATDEQKRRLQILPTETGYLNVRSAPSAKAALSAKTEPGEVYDYLKESGGWYEIMLKDGATGWVSGKYVKILD